MSLFALFRNLVFICTFNVAVLTVQNVFLWYRLVNKLDKLNVNNIMNSISTELDFHAKKYQIQVHDMIKNELHSRLNDI